MNSSHESISLDMSLGGMRPVPLVEGRCPVQDRAARCGGLGALRSNGAGPRCPSAADDGRGVRSAGHDAAEHCRTPGRARSLRTSAATGLEHVMGSLRSMSQCCK